VWFVDARGCFAGATACADVGVGAGADWVVVPPVAAAVAVVVAAVLAAALALAAVGVVPRKSRRIPAFSYASPHPCTMQVGGSPLVSAMLLALASAWGGLVVTCVGLFVGFLAAPTMTPHYLGTRPC
jgi:hypothetical protein